MKSAQGFTLIEAIIYLALFAFMLVGLLSAALNLFEASGRNTTQVMLQEEGNFLLAKLAWALDGAQSVAAPAAGHGGPLLSVDKATGLDGSGNPLGETVVAELDPASGRDLLFAEGTGAPEDITDPDVSLTYLNFFYATSSGLGVDQAQVGVSLTLTARTPGGMLLSQSFFATTSLRQ